MGFKFEFKHGPSCDVSDALRRAEYHADKNGYGSVSLSDLFLAILEQENRDVQYLVRECNLGLKSLTMSFRHQYEKKVDADNAKTVGEPIFLANHGDDNVDAKISEMEAKAKVISDATGFDIKFVNTKGMDGPWFGIFGKFVITTRTP